MMEGPVQEPARLPLFGNSNRQPTHGPNHSPSPAQRGGGPGWGCSTSPAKRGGGPGWGFWQLLVHSISVNPSAPLPPILHIVVPSPLGLRLLSPFSPRRCRRKRPRGSDTVDQRPSIALAPSRVPRPSQNHLSRALLRPRYALSDRASNFISLKQVPTSELEVSESLKWPAMFNVTPSLLMSTVRESNVARYSGNALGLEGNTYISRIVPKALHSQIG